MLRLSALTFLISATVATTVGAQTPSGSTPSDQSAVTFNKEVLPILQKNCQSCHRPGEAGPMSFLTYESTRPWAKAIKAAAVSRKMPPWFADPHFGDFRNAPSLLQSEIDTLAAWADSGAREGSAEDKPATKEWTAGWRIQPDVVVSMTEAYAVAAKGEGEIKQFVIPNPFKQDTWVTSIEIRPGDPSVVHHVILQIPEDASIRPFPWGAANCLACTVDAKKAPVPEVPGIVRPAVLNRGGDERERPSGGYGGQHLSAIGTFTTMEAVYAPGSQPLDFRYHNSAKLIRGGQPIRLEVHYTPNGKDTTDRTMVGFTVAESAPQRRFVMMAPTSLIDHRRPIPAGEANFEAKGELTFTRDAELVWFMPHMHLRGKDMSFRLIYPNGVVDTVLSARFNFNWQLGYEVEQPIRIPRGTRMIVTAHYDNSANNPMNPDPKKEARWGELTSEEMMLPWFGVIVRQGEEPSSIASYRPGGFVASPSGSPTMADTPLPKGNGITPPFNPQPRIFGGRP